MSDATWQRVGRALLGRWPSQVAAWGKEGIAAYVEELQASHLTPEQALTALRMYRPPAGKDFPPSVAAIADLARQDPSKPTFDETLTLVRTALRAYNLPLRGDFTTEGQMIHARERRVLERAEDMHPLVASFINRHGVHRLQDEIGELDEGEYGSVRRRELEQAWESHCEACEGRDLAAIMAPRRSAGLAQLDPLAVLSTVRPKAALPSGGDR